MCLLIVAEKRPDRSLLEMGAEQNKDGGGIAWRQGDIVRWTKGFRGSKGIDEMMEIIKNNEPPYIIHFRLATVGLASDELCHPFAVTNRAFNCTDGETGGFILAHNGHWGSWRAMLDKHEEILTRQRVKLQDVSKDWSDTRAMAFIYSIYGDKFLEYINEKVAVMSPTELKIFKKSIWHEHSEGIMTSYNPVPRSRATTYTYGGYQNWSHKNSGYTSRYYSKWEEDYFKGRMEKDSFLEDDLTADEKAEITQLVRQQLLETGQIKESEIIDV